MKTILIPTDFSKGASNALNYAIDLAKKKKAKIILLHSIYVNEIGPAERTEIILGNKVITKGASNEKLQSKYDSLFKTNKISCEYVSIYGFPAEVILRTIQDKKPWIVVMGTKGASGIKEMLMGSNTAEVIESATCPVIAVPENAKYNGLKNITYATDYHESDIVALKKLVEIAKPFKARITNLHASDEEFNRFSENIYLKTFRNKVRKKIKYDKMSYKLVYGKYLPKVLNQHIKQSSPDVIAMSTERRNLFEKIFGTSVTKKMAFHSEIPLMAFHHKKESVVFI